MTSTTNNFKDLQRKARKIEIQIDQQLVALSKIKKPSRKRSKHEEEPLLDEDDTINRKTEIEDLLSRFSAVLDELSDAAELSENSMQLKSVQHLRTTYENDFEEYRKMCSSLATVGIDVDEQEETFRKTNDSSLYSTRRPKNDAALRENQSAHSSIQMIDEHIIALAFETREQLGVQRSRFKAIQTRVNDIFSHFPRVNNLLQRIHNRKRMEAVILGILIGVLTIALLAFEFS